MAEAGLNSHSSAAPAEAGTQVSLDRQLLDAVKLGTAREVQDLVSRGANVNQLIGSLSQNLVFFAASRRLTPIGGRISLLKVLVQQFGLAAAAVDRGLRHTPLFYAAREGDAEACAFLLDQKCSPDHSDENMQTALFFASRHGQDDVAKLLISRRAVVDRQDNLSSQTPLFWAAIGGHPNVMRTLLAGKASIDHTTQQGYTCLFVAKGDAVAVAVKAGCDPNHRDRLCKTALFLAASAGDVVKVQTLVRLGAEVDAVDVDGWTCLFHAAKKGYVEVIELLCLELRADVAHRDKAGKIARAAWEGPSASPVVQALLKAEKKKAAEAKRSAEKVLVAADASPPTESSGTPEERLYWAVKQGTLKEVQALLEAGARPTPVHSGQNLAFLAAARMPCDEPRTMIELLGKHGVDLDQVDQQWQQTPLFFAVRKDPRSAGSECAKFLLDSRCDGNRKDIHGQTPLFYAAQRDDPACAEVLLRAGASPNVQDALEGETALFLAAKTLGAERTLRALLDGKADSQLSDAQGRSALFGVRSVAAAELLAESGCRVGIRDSSGRTCLFPMAETCSLELFRALRDMRGDVNAVDNNGETCLFHAARVPDANAAMAMCRLLVKDSGASGEVKNLSGRTPAQVASSAALKKWLISMAAAPEDESTLGGQKRTFHVAFEDALMPGRMILPGMQGYDSALSNFLKHAEWLRGWDS